MSCSPVTPQPAITQPLIVHVNDSVGEYLKSYSIPRQYR